MSSELREANFFIVTVPIPIDAAKLPDLSHLVKTHAMIGKVVRKGSVVVYESTVYPGEALKNSGWFAAAHHSRRSSGASGTSFQPYFIKLVTPFRGLIEIGRLSYFCRLQRQSPRGKNHMPV